MTIAYKDLFKGTSEKGIPICMQRIIGFSFREISPWLDLDAYDPWLKSAATDL